MATAKHTIPNITCITLTSLLFSFELREKYFVSIINFTGNLSFFPITVKSQYYCLEYLPFHGEKFLFLRAICLKTDRI